MSQHRTVLTYGVPEGTTPTITTILEDKDGNSVAGSALQSLILTLYEANSRKVIHGRNQEDVLDGDASTATRGVTVDAQGVLTWDLDVEDTQVLFPDKTGESEHHVALFEFSFNSGSSVKVGKHEIVIPIDHLEVG